MPNRKQLQVFDKIRLLRVPQADLEQRERELREGLDDAGHTANTLERIIRENPIVTIRRIDEYGTPWFERKLKNADGAIEWHSMGIVDDESWEFDE